MQTFKTSLLTWFYVFFLLIVITATPIFFFGAGSTLISIQIVLFLVCSSVGLFRLTEQVIVFDTGKICRKNILTNKEIQITSDSKIFYKQFSYKIQFFFTIRVNTITILKEGKKLKINADVKNFEQLYQLIKEHEIGIILPKLDMQMQSSRKVNFSKDISLTNEAFIYRKKTIPFKDNISNYYFSNNYFVLSKKKGFKKVALKVNIEKIPNINCLAILLNQKIPRMSD